MTTYSGAGRKREPGEMWNEKLFTTTSLDDAGFVLTWKEETNVGKVDKCGSTDVPYAINWRSTRDPHDMNFPTTLFLQGNSELLEGGIAILREGWANVKLATNNSALEKGDPVVCNGSGKVDLYTPTVIGQTSNTAVDAEARFDELARIVGHVEEENVAAGDTGKASQDKVYLKLSIRAIGIKT